MCYPRQLRPVTMQSLDAACEEGEASPIMSCPCDGKSSSSSINACGVKPPASNSMVCSTHSRSFKKAKISRSSSSLLLQEAPTSSAATDPPQTSKPPFCIHTKLLELYLEECANDPNQLKTGLKRDSHLLGKLVARERLNTLILNLHIGNNGYSLSFPTTPVADVCAEDTAELIETKMWPYEDKELLAYIDNEELPAFFVDLLEPHYGFLFYSGCVIAEVRDYRQTYPSTKYNVHHVLLKPTLQSILADVRKLVESREEWGAEEKQQLESQILLANHPALCLDPKSTVCTTASKINNNRQIFNTYRLRRAARKYSQVYVNRKKKLVLCTHPPGLQLYESLMRMPNRLRPGDSSKGPRKIHEEIKPIPVPSLEPPPLLPPSQGVHIGEFKAYPPPVVTSDCLPQPVEEYVLETDMHSKDKSRRRIYHIKLSILQRPSTGEYLGELYLDRDHKKGEQNGVACRFTLGSRAHTNQYIQQFIEIFTEGGRKSVKMSYGLKEMAAPVQPQMQNQHTSQVNLSAQQLVSQHLGQLSQSLQNQASAAPLINGTVNTGIQLVQQGQPVQNSSVPILQAQLKANTVRPASQVPTSEEMEINALVTELMNSSQQYQAKQKQQQQQQQQQQQNAVAASNPAMINLLNSSPASSINTDVLGAATGSQSLLPQQVQAINQKLLGRKITLSNVQNTRVLNHGNLIAVNNNRHISQQPQQTITLATVNSGGLTHTNYTTVPVKTQPVNQRIVPGSDGGKTTTLCTLLAGMPAADLPDIIGSSTNSLLFEKLAAATVTSPNPAQSPTHFIQSPKSAQFTVQSPKANATMSSPPPQGAGTINVQGLNFAPMQVQLSGFSQPISLSLNVSSTGALQGHPTSLLVSVPVTGNTATATTVGVQGGSGAGNSMAPTVVLANAGTSNIAQLVTSGVKGLAQQRAGQTASVALAQAAASGQPFQLITPIQRPARTGQVVNPQTMQAARNLQRTTPITIKMATTQQANLSQVTNAQKQAQVHQYQQMCMKQQQDLNLPKVRRRPNVWEPQ